MNRTTCAIVGGGPAGMRAGPAARPAPAWRSRCWRSTPTSSATSAATPSIRRPCDLLDELGLVGGSPRCRSAGCSRGRLPGPTGQRSSIADFTRLRVRASVHRDGAAMGPARPRSPRPPPRSRRSRCASGTEVTGAHPRAAVGCVGVRVPLADGRRASSAPTSRSRATAAGRSSADAVGLPAQAVPGAASMSGGTGCHARRADLGESLLPGSGKGRVAIVIPRRGLRPGRATSATRAPTPPSARAGSTRSARDIAELVPELAGPGRRASRRWTTSSTSMCASTACAAGTSPGVLCIGDAAHAMSPVGGVGINLAVQDAVAAAAHPRQPFASRHVPRQRSRSRSRARACAAPANPAHGHGSRRCSASSTRSSSCPRSAAQASRRRAG